MGSPECQLRKAVSVGGGFSLSNGGAERKNSTGAGKSVGDLTCGFSEITGPWRKDQAEYVLSGRMIL